MDSCWNEFSENANTDDGDCAGNAYIFIEDYCYTNRFTLANFYGDSNRFHHSKVNDQSEHTNDPNAN